MVMQMQDLIHALRAICCVNCLQDWMSNGLCARDFLMYICMHPSTLQAMSATTACES